MQQLSDSEARVLWEGMAEVQQGQGKSVERQLYILSDSLLVVTVKGKLKLKHQIPLAGLQLRDVADTGGMSLHLLLPCFVSVSDFGRFYTSARSSHRAEPTKLSHHKQSCGLQVLFVSSSGGCGPIAGHFAEEG